MMEAPAERSVHSGAIRNTIFGNAHTLEIFFQAALAPLEQSVGVSEEALVAPAPPPTALICKEEV